MRLAVLWDVDGTLVDTEALHYAALEAVGAVAGYGMSPARMRSFTGLTMEGVWEMLDREFALALPYEPWIAAITAHYARNIKKAPLRAGAAGALVRIAGLGASQAAVSNATRGIVDANLTRLPDPSLLRFSIAREDVPRGKPDPAPYLEAARRLGLKPSQCIAVEDSPTGARSASAAGMFTLYWPEEPGEKEGPPAEFADRTIAAISDVDWSGLLSGGR